MIDKEYGRLIMVCDNCGCVLNDKDETFRDYAEIRLAAKAAGWIEQGVYDECPDCQEGE